MSQPLFLIVMISKNEATTLPRLMSSLLCGNFKSEAEKSLFLLDRHVKQRRTEAIGGLW
jgi:hypothetical protein